MTAKKEIRSRRTPIYREVGFVFENIEQSEQAFEMERRDPRKTEYYFYTRYANPNVVETEGLIASLEGSDWAMLTASGMSAIDVALSVFHKADRTGPWLFFHDIYGGTKDYIAEILHARRGVRTEYFNSVAGEERFDLDELQRTLDHLQPSLLYFEPVSNPLLLVADGETVIRMAKERGMNVVVDNTFATPLLWHPLESGADIVLHSATKYLAGHGNITAGAVCGNDPEWHKAALLYRKLVGHIVSPDDAYRLATQLKTFELRVAKQCENACQLAHMLNDHPHVENVRYPGLPSHPTHQEAHTLFGDTGFGAMVTFELKGGRPVCDAFIARIAEHVKYVTSLGDPESILIHVPTVFGADRFPYPGMIRFSVGFEPYYELEHHVLQALEACEGAYYETL